MVNFVFAVIAALIFLAPPPPVQPTGYVRPRAYIPMIAGQDYGVRIESIPVARPAIWVHVKFVEPDAHAKAQALIFNPEHPGGLWTVLTPIEPGWFRIQYRLEWNETPEWLPDPTIWEPFKPAAPPGDAPNWWHEQRMFRVVGKGFVVDAVFVDLWRDQ